MKTHENYFEIEADSYYELGLQRGELFGEFMRGSVELMKEDRSWKVDRERAKKYVPYAAKAFPNLIEEIHGYAEGARVCFEDAWQLIIEDDLAEYNGGGRCSTMITNGGQLVAHNEDWWEEDAEEAICVLRKKVGQLSSFELFYMNTLGGNSISFNSHGYLLAVNSLAHTDNQLGVPRNITCRWLSETSSPEGDFAKLAKIRRASGYHHNIIHHTGRIWGIECSATQQVLLRPESPYVHTNHFLTDLRRFEPKDSIRGTHTRYRCAMENLSDPMSLKSARALLSDTSQGRKRSIFNEWTVAHVVVNLRNLDAHVWLRREPNKGWITYDLSQVLAHHSRAGGSALPVR